MLTGRHIPHMGRGVGRRSYPEFPRTKGHARKPTFVSLEHLYLLARAGIPGAVRCRPPTRWRSASRRRESDFVDAVVMALKFMDRGQGRPIPHHDPTVKTTGNER